jgi:hypothetical protein
MKKYFFLFLLGLSILGSCTKAALSGQSLSVKVDGADWTATSVTGTTSGGILVINATKGDGSSVSLQMPWPIPLGKHECFYPEHYAMAYTPANTDAYVVDNTTDYITINSYDNAVLKGSFYGPLRQSGTSNSKDLESGSFTVNVK